MRTAIDLSGKRFGHWTVLERDTEIKKKNIYWKCKCDCGTFRSVAGTSLRGGISTSCGCEKDLKTSIRTKRQVTDITGQRFGMWTVLCQDLSEDKVTRGSRWICKCDCGTTKSVSGQALRFGRSTCCGCRNGQGNIQDLTGNRYGRLVVIKRDTKDYHDKKGSRWICKCDCGQEVSVLAGRLKSGQKKSCGCMKYVGNSTKPTDLSGQKIGLWTVLSKDESYKGKGTHYKCQCECGTIKTISADALKRGVSRSCGCARSIPKEDLTGQHFGKLTVLGIDKEKYRQGIFWLCKCDCGNIVSINHYNLKVGSNISCGCESKRLSSERAFKDITNKRFGRLTALKVDHTEKDHYGTTYYWLCKCDCGNTIVVQSSVLRRGDTKSCGCLQKEASADRAKSRIIDLVGRRFGKLTVIERVESPDKDNYSIWKCLCDCGNEKLANGYHLKRGMIASCGCLKQSKYELYVLQYLNEQEYESPEDYEYQKRFDDLRGYGEGMLSYDFAIYRNGKLSALIECQGLQHYKPIELFGGEEQFAKQQIHDELKKEYAKSLNVPLIEIPYTAETYEKVKEILQKENI